MLIASVEFINVVLFLHILGAVIWLGPTYGYAFFIATAESAHPRAIPSVMESILKIDRTLGTVGMLLVIASGIYLVEDIGWDYGEFFVSWGMAVFLLIVGLTHGYFGPRTRRLGEIAVRDLGASGEGSLSDEYQALSRQVAMVGTFAGLAAALTIYVMAAKPFL
jgi:uncharacterized membrane protein